jgi:hypothetical protein
MEGVYIFDMVVYLRRERRNEFYLYLDETFLA